MIQILDTFSYNKSIADNEFRARGPPAGTSEVRNQIRNVGSELTHLES